jgi:rusticyanin
MFKKSFVKPIIFLLVLASLLVFGYAYSNGFCAYGNGYGPGMMNGYYNNQSNYQTMQTNQLKSFSELAGNVTIDNKNNSIIFNDQNIIIPVVASPTDNSMYSFGIGNLINPTIVVRKNSNINLKLVNNDDDMYHGIIITNTPPPYPYTVMMNVSLAFQYSAIRPLPYEDKQNKLLATGSTEFNANEPGTYYYICQVPGHAQQGMYGKFIVLDK